MLNIDVTGRPCAELGGKFGGVENLQDTLDVGDLVGGAGNEQGVGTSFGNDPQRVRAGSQRIDPGHVHQATAQRRETSGDFPKETAAGTARCGCHRTLREEPLEHQGGLGRVG